ncbi:DDRGK domain-containing protein 1 [Plasmodiophora brassicae]|uniref:DDRGK domain-containing protein 1 n=2 Tax=Plasmodiophora brassicae TaxID=37360 RepID=A0A3P3YCC2_PLABS|nr:unnamed protein product [Plasmodiophora brassicae]
MASADGADGTSSLALLLTYFTAMFAVVIAAIVWIRRQGSSAPAAEEAPAGGGRRQRRGLRDMMQQADGDNRRAARAAPPAESAGPTKYEEKMAAKEAARQAKEAAAAAEREAKRQAEAKRVEAEYDQWKDLIVEEEAGTGVADTEDFAGADLLEAFVQHIKDRKMVAIEELAVRFEMGSAQNVLDRIKDLEADGRLSGVVDDRGKYIYVSREQFDQVAEFINERGRVSVADIVSACNRLIDVTPAVTDDFDSKALFGEESDDLNDGDAGNTRQE